MAKPILNLADAPVIDGSSGKHFEYTLRSLTRPLAATSIGANVTTVPPGKAAFPFHHHHANEEHFFVLSGSGTLRLGEQTYPVRQHDYIVNPAGGPDLAHQLINTGDDDLVYLAISTLTVPEVVGYPDSGKTGVRTGMGDQPGTRFLVVDSDKGSVGYWDGESGEMVARIAGRSR